MRMPKQYSSKGSGWNVITKRQRPQKPQSLLRKPHMKLCASDPTKMQFDLVLPHTGTIVPISNRELVLGLVGREEGARTALVHRGDARTLIFRELQEPGGGGAVAAPVAHGMDRVQADY